MTPLVISRKKVITFTSIIIIFLTGQVIGVSVNQSNSLDNNDYNFSDEDLINQIKIATSSLTSLFNEKEGLFVWNVQDPYNLSQFGDLSDLTNGQEGFKYLDGLLWLNGIAQDVSLQYLLLKNYVSTSLQFIGTMEEHKQFNRDWVFMTYDIIHSLYNNVANSDFLLSVLNALSSNEDSFGEYWNVLIRTKYNSFIQEEISLLGDTLVLGSKILRVAEFMPYFNFYEKSVLLTLSDQISDWWQAINKYALYDPDFAIAGIGSSKIHSDYQKWIDWQIFKDSARNGTFATTDVFTHDHRDFQRLLFTSPQIANLYLEQIEKANARHSYGWNTDHHSYEIISDPLAHEIYHEIIDSYFEHIFYVHNHVTYVFNPQYNDGWTSLPDLYQGYSYYWEKYFIDSQGSENDLYAYRNDKSPLKITGTRTFQGAGDIRGLMDIYKVLSHSFTDDNYLQGFEKESFTILEQILKTQRNDRSFVFSPYFGTALDESLVNNPLINDASIINPDVLPEGLDQFTGTMSVMDFILKAQSDLVVFGTEKMTYLNDQVQSTILSITELFDLMTHRSTMGIPKQTILGNTNPTEHETYYYSAENIVVNINFFDMAPNILLPDWIANYNPLTFLGTSYIYQWDYLTLLKEAFLNLQNPDIVTPIFDSLLLFNEDFSQDNQYQLLSICEAKDAVARTLFTEALIDSCIILSDKTGIYGSAIPYKYRTGVSPVTNVFASETPQRVSALILSILPLLSDIADVISNPINQIVIFGFVSGVVMTIAVIYIRRPKHQ
ncbi:MAG: hypothetical protein ACTSPC_03350 [Candidatus Heimdallarchaeota archaeon]